MVFTKLKILILGNCIKAGRLLLEYHISIELQSLLYQSNLSSSLTCLPSVLLVRIQYEYVSKAFNVMVVFVGNIVLVERESLSVITVLLCKLVLPSIGAVLPVCRNDI